MVIVAKDVEIVASSDSSITSKARGSNKVNTKITFFVAHTDPGIIIEKIYIKACKICKKIIEHWQMQMLYWVRVQTLC